MFSSIKKLWDENHANPVAWIALVLMSPIIFFLFLGAPLLAFVCGPIVVIYILVDYLNNRSKNIEVCMEENASIILYFTIYFFLFIFLDSAGLMQTKIGQPGFFSTNFIIFGIYSVIAYICYYIAVAKPKKNRKKREEERKKREEEKRKKEKKKEEENKKKEEEKEKKKKEKETKKRIHKFRKKRM